MYTLFVLDYDDTFSMEYKESLGLTPSVYLIRTEELRDVQHYAELTHQDFHDNNLGMTIGEIFEEWLDNNSIFYQFVGTLKIPFEERMAGYLADRVPIVVI